MSSESVIHIKLNYNEFLNIRKGILSSQLNSLNITKSIANYKDIRMRELTLKNRLYWKIKETKAQIRKLQNFLPNPKIPKIIKMEERMEEKQEAERRPQKEGEDIESQLKEIQNRLKELQRENI